ncbi:MAG: ATP-binding protein [Deltaproteobacteria bacterium]|nr:ATP-binding protein [Deltaproteobacteria bacterium]
MSADRRSLAAVIERDLQKKFVFLSGPRQVGKTTLARQIIAAMGGQYLLYDDDDDRVSILKKNYVGAGVVGLDEFHKFPRWKHHLKGVFDKHHAHLKLLLTGSARLDVFQKSGDSLFGRYYLHHLHPFTCGELQHGTIPPLPHDPLEPHAALDTLPSLLRFGGFPEPYVGQSDTEHRRWSNARRQLLVREELRELTHIHLLNLVEHLMLLLPERIGSPFSQRALAEDIRVSPPTIAQWMEIFERLFVVFTATPYAKRIARSIQRQPKYYFYDWSQLPDDGARFENCVASHLWKAVQLWTDVGLATLGLHTIRDRDRREVDFLVTRDRQPWFLVETKLAETQIAEPLRHFSARLRIPGIQLVLKENVAKREGNVAVLSANRWLGHLP